MGTAKPEMSLQHRLCDSTEGEPGADDAVISSALFFAVALGVEVIVENVEAVELPHPVAAVIELPSRLAGGGGTPPGASDAGGGFLEPIRP